MAIFLPAGLVHVTAKLAVDRVDLLNDIGILERIFLGVLERHDRIVAMRLEGVTVQTGEKGESIGIPAPPEVLTQFS